MWTCASCGERHDDQYATCWNCLAPRAPGMTPMPPVGGVNHPNPRGHKVQYLPDITVSTTPTLETHVIRQYLGVVAGEAVINASNSNELARAIAADVASPKSGRFEKVKNMRRNALIDAAEQAVEMGANGIVGVGFEYNLIGSMLLISCHGTAVLLEKLVSNDFVDF